MNNNLNFVDSEAYKALEIINKLIQKEIGAALNNTQASILIILWNNKSSITYKIIASQLGLTATGVKKAAAKLFVLLNEVFPDFGVINKRNIQMTLFPIIRAKISSKKALSTDIKINNESNYNTISLNKNKEFKKKYQEDLAKKNIIALNINESESSFKKFEKRVDYQIEPNKSILVETQNDKEESYQLSIKIPVRIIKEIDKIAKQEFSDLILTHSEIILYALEFYLKNYRLKQDSEQKQKRETINFAREEILKIIAPELKTIKENNINEIKYIVEELISNILTKNNLNLHKALNERIKPIEDRLNLNSIPQQNNLDIKEERDNLITNSIQVEKGLTDFELASLFGVSKSIVRRWRLGSSKPRGNNLKRLKDWEVKGDRWYKKPLNSGVAE